MKKIEPGIACKVIGGALYPSPNLGKIVTVIQYEGEHSLHGPIWKCSLSTPGVTEYGAAGLKMDFAEDWLDPINPESLKKVNSNEISV